MHHVSKISHRFLLKHMTLCYVPVFILCKVLTLITCMSNCPVQGGTEEASSAEGECNDYEGWILSYLSYLCILIVIN